MGQLDEVSHAIGALDAKVSVILDYKPDYDRKINEVNAKLDGLTAALHSYDLPSMKSEVDSVRRGKWIMMGAAASTGAVAGGGFFHWFKSALGQILS